MTNIELSKDKRKRYCYILFTAVIAYFITSTTSCRENNPIVFKNVIPIESSVETDSILNLSDYVTDIKYIPLETNDSVLISEIYQIVYENGSIIVNSERVERQRECLVFNDYGVFCNKIGQRGQDLNEYISISSIFAFGNLIFLHTYPTGLMAFNRDGTFVKKISMPDNLNSGDQIKKVLPLYSNTDRKSVV